MLLEGDKRRSESLRIDLNGMHINNYEISVTIIWNPIGALKSRLMEYAVYCMAF